MKIGRKHGVCVCCGRMTPKFLKGKGSYRNKIGVFFIYVCDPCYTNPDLFKRIRLNEAMEKQIKETAKESIQQ